MADSDALSLGLDDIIRLDREGNRRGGRGSNRGLRGRSGRGMGNVFRNRGGGSTPRGPNQAAAGSRWKHDLYEDNTNRGYEGSRGMGVNSTTKILISNLDFGVTSDDIQELFGDLGAIRSAYVHYDEAGRPLGTAEVVYERRVDAINAQKKYNTLNLDGRPMDIKLLGNTDSESRAQSSRFSAVNGSGINRTQRGTRRNYNQQSNFRANRGRGGKQKSTTVNEKNEVTLEDLDADLEAYRATSKQKK